MADMRLAALASLGLAVFPVRPGRKEPAVRDWLTRASTDPDEVRRLFSGRERFNIGVVTGEVSGAFVLDVDCKGADGRATLVGLEHLHGRLPTTWEAETPSGGLHMWFAYPAKRQVGNRVGFAPGLDIRGAGGFVVAPPSVLGAGAYRWARNPAATALAEAPGWLLDLAAPLPPPVTARAPLRLPVGGRDRTARYVAGALSGEMRRLESAPPGHRNQLLFQAAANLGELVGAGVLGAGLAEDGLFLAAEACGLVRDDGRHPVRATIASGLRRGMANPRAMPA